MTECKIGGVALRSPALLAPMAGVSDRAYRELCMDMGAGYCVSEMVSSKALSFHSKKSEELMEISARERPCGIQIFGDEPSCMADAARHAKENHPDIIDINMGCPAPKISGNGSGSALMRHPQLCGEIVRAVVAVSDVPVTVKIRKGWDDESVNAVEIAKICEQAGASAITVHGRTRMQFYHPPVDYEIIRQVRHSVSIPVIANGDISLSIGKDIDTISFWELGSALGIRGLILDVEGTVDLTGNVASHTIKGLLVDVMGFNAAIHIEFL